MMRKVLYLQVCVWPHGYPMLSGPRSLPWSVVPCPFWLVPQSCQWSCPKFCLRSCLGEGVPLSWLGGLPQPGTGGIFGQDRGSSGTECTPWQDRGTSLSRDRGYPHPTTSQNQGDCAVWVVCFLRSSRRTFVFFSEKI